MSVEQWRQVDIWQTKLHISGCTAVPQRGGLASLPAAKRQEAGNGVTSCFVMTVLLIVEDA